MAEKTQFAGGSLPSCMKCRYFDTITNIARGQSVHICRLNPPKVFAFPAMAAPGEMSWVTQTAWPQVAASDWCAQYRGSLDS